MEAVVRFSDITFEQLQQMKRDIFLLVEVDWENVWKSMMDLIYVDFFEGLLEIFRQCKERFAANVKK